MAAKRTASRGSKTASVAATGVVDDAGSLNSSASAVFRDISAGILRSIPRCSDTVTAGSDMITFFTGLFTDGPAAELHLKSGIVLKGTSFGAHGVEMTGELVFNTGMFSG